jgi:hypothetical protein
MTADERTTFAEQAAATAMSISRAYGILFESLMACMRDSGLLSSDKIRLVFISAATAIDEVPATSDVEQAVKEAMRDVVERSARVFDIEIPPMGGTRLSTNH